MRSPGSVPLRLDQAHTVVRPLPSLSYRLGSAKTHEGDRDAAAGLRELSGATGAFAARSHAADPPNGVTADQHVRRDAESFV